MGLIERIKRIEAKIAEDKQSEYPDNDDGFITALGVNPEDYKVPSGGYDVMAALKASLADCWEEGVE